MNAARLDILVEVGVEELPAAWAPTMAEALAAGLAAALSAEGLRPEGGDGVTVLGTPRRLTAHIADVLAQPPHRDETVLGPPARVAFDDQGAPTRAAEAFARGLGVEVAALTRVDTDKGAYVGLHRRVQGRPAAAVLAEGLPTILRNLPCPKKMRWGVGREGFLRPVQWIVALADDLVIPFRFADVASGRLSHGHRFYGEDPDGGLLGEPVPVLRADLTLYRHLMRAARVMVDPAERRATILDGARRLAVEAGGVLVEDDETLATVTWLVEWPTPLLGSFRSDLLRIPDAVTQTTLRANQKLFTVRGAQGKLLPRFVAVANTLHPGRERVIAAGNARVVSARMADAAFFYDADRAQPLEAYLPKLAGRTFLEGLGSTLDKVHRIERLAGLLAAHLAPAQAAAVARAAVLGKADLATQMVFEFPELQGEIGEDYALAAGEAPEVAAAVREHYLPRGADDALPEGVVGAIVAVADRLDSLAACFALGLVPTGSNDPYALRRAALGVVRILVDPKRHWTSSLRQMLDAAVQGLPASPQRRPDAEVVHEIAGFFEARLRAWLTDASRGAGAAFFAADIADAVLGCGFDDVPGVFERAEALTKVRRHDEETFHALAAGFKRIGNLLRKADVSDRDGAVDAGAFERDAEISLHAAVVRLKTEVAVAVEARAWERALELLATLRPAIDAFFDDVMVMADDPVVRRNRLALLRDAAAVFARVADLGRLQGGNR